MSSTVMGRLLVGSVCVAGILSAPAASFLFDATKAEMAGNADWVIDADLHDLGVSSAANGSGVVGAGSESDPQRFPTPDQSGITASTPETYWEGALSSWGVDLVKNGQHLETLPYNGHITFQDGSNAQDLTNYDVFVLVEPNIYFTAAEKTALIRFVTNGGGLFMVSDHAVADRNNDGSDAYQVLNDLMTNSVQNNPFGIRYNGDNISPSSANPDTSPTDPITHGSAGTMTSLSYFNGSSISVNTNQNPTAKIAFWTSSTHGTNNGMIAYATFGKGKVVALGDSSPFDDGTGDPGDSLSSDYATDGRVGILNASLWLAILPPAAPTPPLLHIVPLTNSVQVIWPTSTVSFALQASTNLLVTNAWNLVTNAPQPVGTNFVVTVPETNGGVFYRLLEVP